MIGFYDSILLPLNRTSKILSSESLIITEEIIAFDNVEILCETRVKLMREDYGLKTSHRRN